LLLLRASTQPAAKSRRHLPSRWPTDPG